MLERLNVKMYEEGLVDLVVKVKLDQLDAEYVVRIPGGMSPRAFGGVQNLVWVSEIPEDEPVKDWIETLANACVPTWWE